MIKRILKIFIFLIVLVSFLLETSYSLAVEVTEENLNQAFMEYVSSELLYNHKLLSATKAILLHDSSEM